jgi:hypothetical protein
VSASVPIDLRCEENAAAGNETEMVSVASRATSRAVGDLDRIASGQDWCCLTCAPGDGDAATETLVRMPSSWSGLVRVVPSDWGGETALLPWLIDDVAAALSRIGRSLLVDLDHVLPPWQSIFRVAASFPNLALIVGAGSATHLRIAKALCLSCPNVYLDTSQLDASELVQLVARLGEDRLVFGSDSPRGNPTTALATVMSAGLSDSQTDQILWGNAKHLLTGPR